MAGAALLVAVGVAQAVATVSVTGIENELAFRNDSHNALAQVLKDPRVRADLKHCGPLSLPNHKLMPDARWLLDAPAERDRRAQPGAHTRTPGNATLRERATHGVAVYPLGEAVFRQALVEQSDNPLDQVPMRGLPTDPDQPVLRGLCPLRIAPLWRARGGGRAGGAGCARAEAGRARLARPGRSSRARWGCACGASRRACPTRTTPTRTITSRRRRSRCLKTG